MAAPSASPLEFPDALALVLSHAAALPPPAQETVPLAGALHRTLAAPIVADRNQPPFRRSTRDGFAATADSLTAGAPVRIIGTVRAGEAWPELGSPLGPGDAVAIMTGAPVPPGADVVLMSEHAQRKGDALTMKAGRTLSAGDNIVAEGGEAAHGEILVPAKSRLTPAEIALAATCGITAPAVYVRPRVTVLATGDELVPPHAAPAPYQVRNSNSAALAALLGDAQAIAVADEILRDELESIESSLRRVAASEADLLLLSGGVSVGDYDFVEQALSRLGADFFFTGVNMQPGRPVVFGRIPRVQSQPLYFFGLPGNPVSVHVCFLLFVAPFLAALGGAIPAPPRFALATLAEEVSVKPGTQKFLPAHLSADFSAPTIRRIPWQGSGDLTANARANCYLALPPDCAALAAGSHVRVLLR